MSPIATNDALNSSRASEHSSELLKLIRASSYFPILIPLWWRLNRAATYFVRVSFSLPSRVAVVLLRTASRFPVGVAAQKAPIISSFMRLLLPLVQLPRKLSPCLGYTVSAAFSPTTAQFGMRGAMRTPAVHFPDPLVAPLALPWEHSWL